MTRGGTIGVSVVLTVAVGLLVAWFLYTYERKEIDVPLPSRGEAVFNPLYAMKQSLQHAGQRVHARARLVDAAHPLGARDTVVLNGDPDLLQARETQLLLDWVERGGHLVVQAPGRVVGEDEESLVASLGVRGGQSTDGTQCMTVDKLTSMDRDPGADNPEEFIFDDETDDKPKVAAYDLYCWRRFSLARDADPQLEWHDDRGTVFARFAHGLGSVDVVPDLYPLTRQSLQRREHGAFARQLLAPNWGRGTFHLVYSTDMPSLWTLLAQHAWKFFVPLILLLCAWLAMRMQRFGPLLASPPEARRSLLEHVQASGEHLYRYGRAHLLHQALRRHVLARVRRRDPVAASLEGQAQVGALATRTGLPEQDVVDALHSPRPLDDRDFRHRIARLIALGRNA